MAVLGFAVRKEIAVWASIEFLQLVGYLPLIASDLDPDTARFLGSFNWFNVQRNPIGIMLGDLDNAPSIQMKFAQINSANFLVNGGLMLVIILVALIIYGIGASIPYTSRNNACVFTTNLIAKGIFIISFLPLLISSFV